MRVGFIGLGLMGVHMARHAMKAGHELTVWARKQQSAEPLLVEGAAWAGSAAAVAARSDLVITMLTDAKAVEEVVCGVGGVLEGARPGLILIDCSSIPAEVSQSIAARAGEVGVRMLDAPVTGNPTVAAAGKLGIMIGGEAETLRQAREILEAMSSIIVHAGGSGAGCNLKSINNLILGVAIQVVAEALILARKSGIDPDCVRQITTVGGARTGAMETRGKRMIDHDFSPHFSTDNMHKDLSTAVLMADRVGAPTPTAVAALEVLKCARAQGKGGLDSSVVYALLEDMSGLRA